MTQFNASLLNKSIDKKKSYWPQTFEQVLSVYLKCTSVLKMGLFRFNGWWQILELGQG